VPNTLGRKNWLSNLIFETKHAKNDHDGSTKAAVPTAPLVHT